MHGKIIFFEMLICQICRPTRLCVSWWDIRRLLARIFISGFGVRTHYNCCNRKEKEKSRELTEIFRDPYHRSFVSIHSWTPVFRQKLDSCFPPKLWAANSRHLNLTTNPCESFTHGFILTSPNSYSLRQKILLSEP